MRKEIVAKILDILKSKQGSDIGSEKVVNDWVVVNDDGELYIEFSLFYDIFIINEIRLKNKRRGTLTEIVDYLQVIGKSIYIVSVITEEMYEFCKKNKFQRQEGLGYGDFYRV